MLPIEVSCYKQYVLQLNCKEKINSSQMYRVVRLCD